MSQAELDETAVENFREYLRIPSVHPDVNYGEQGSVTRGGSLPEVFFFFFSGKAALDRGGRAGRGGERKRRRERRREICDARLKASGGGESAMRDGGSRGKPAVKARETVFSPGEREKKRKRRKEVRDVRDPRRDRRRPRTGSREHAAQRRASSLSKLPRIARRAKGVPSAGEPPRAWRRVRSPPP